LLGAVAAAALGFLFLQIEFFQTESPLAGPIRPSLQPLPRQVLEVRRRRLRRHGHRLRRYHRPVDDQREKEEGSHLRAKSEGHERDLKAAPAPKARRAAKPRVHIPDPGLPASAGAAAALPVPDTWTEAEIDAAGKECNRRMAGLHADFSPVPPIKDAACGSAAPIRLRRFRNEKPAPDLSFSPEPVVSCRLAEALRRWFDTDVQPAAVTLLGSPVVRMSNLSSYNCRQRYNNPSAKISEHAFANAIDIGEFTTAKGEHVSVLDSWNAGDDRAVFLHTIHAGACLIFGTTLGPEANAEHKNHFHLDMKERRRPLCDFTPEQAHARTATGAAQQH
jgi:hypothetical protein